MRYVTLAGTEEALGVDADYIIIGGGSAGCVLANRLSADGRHRVVLLEAGGSDLHPWTQIPIAYGKCFYHPRLNWRYESAPVPGLDDRTIYCPRGKVLGGSSAINAMVFIRGQREDYDGWRDLGNAGWGYDDVLPYFQRLERDEAGPVSSHAEGGPLTITEISGSAHPLCTDFLAAAASAGLSFNPDFNDATQEGAGFYRITTRRGLRVSSATAYLRPVLSRPNLQVIRQALATRIVFEGNRAVAVDYSRGGDRSLRVHARREVVVAAGAVNSPQLLQLSGIGDPALLQRHGIAVLHAAPAVGENLQDHLCIDYLYKSRKASLNETLRPLWRRPLLAAQYLLTRSGPLSLSVNQAGGFFRTRQDLQRPDMQLYFSALSYTRASPGKRQLMRPDPFPGFLLSVSNCHPLSRGHIRIQAADPFKPPIIQPNYLADDRDLSELVLGARFIRRLAAQPALAEIIAEEFRPGIEVMSEAEMRADIRKRATSVFHLSGTCAMGPDPRNAVVDPRLRVHGVQGLRIVDASIFPRLVSGNTNAPTMMIGEKGADLILSDLR
ncbi:choline dehydrogenase [Rhodoligotrophos appendicifer]|uniref:GMC family oxidoreductase n=1 Tax=Rhodoligotrophos appendicifer TaxID=987056 RepID=UPI001186809D|nr:GMC family oxidoreductase N-terminal domain-containing protein [Rhodoligotrophos appendicifer]